MKFEEKILIFIETGCTLVAATLIGYYVWECFKLIWRWGGN